MIKTIHFTNAYHAQSGGIRRFYQAMLAAAGIEGRELRLVVPAERSSIEEVNDYARIYHVRAPRSAAIDRRYRLILPYRYLFGAQGPIWQILRREKPELIEICDKYALCFLGGLIRRGWLTGAPRPAMVGLTCERMDDSVRAFVTGRPRAERFAAWYMRTVYIPQFDGHIAVSRYTADEVDIGLRPVHIAPMGLHVGQFNRAFRSATARRELFGERLLDPRAVVLLYVGRLSAEKNLPLLLDVMSQLSTDQHHAYHLYLVGEGPLRNWLVQEGERRAPGRVHLEGHVEGRQTLARIYANADVLLHPNSREPLGLAPLEAMASGLPLVAPASGGVVDYADRDNAWLTDPTPHAFAQSVIAVLGDAGQTSHKVARARATAEAHDWSLIARRYFALYDHLHQQSAPIRHLPTSIRADHLSREKAVGRDHESPAGDGKPVTPFV